MWTRRHDGVTRSSVPPLPQGTAAVSALMPTCALLIGTAGEEVKLLRVLRRFGYWPSPVFFPGSTWPRGDPAGRASGRWLSSSKTNRSGGEGCSRLTMTDGFAALISLPKPYSSFASFNVWYLPSSSAGQPPAAPRQPSHRREVALSSRFHVSVTHQRAALTGAGRGRWLAPPPPARPGLGTSVTRNRVGSCSRSAGVDEAEPARTWDAPRPSLTPGRFRH